MYLWTKCQNLLSYFLDMKIEEIHTSKLCIRNITTPLDLISFWNTAAHIYGILYITIMK